MFKYEMHCHTSAVSPCSLCSTKDLIKAYKKIGFSGLVLTDHMSHFSHGESWREKRQLYLENFALAEKLGKKAGITVLLGVEITLSVHNADYLLYGLDIDAFKMMPNVLNWNVKELSEWTHEQGALIYQAHPFRFERKPITHLHIDGIEIYNGNQHHDCFYDKGVEFVKEHNLLALSGTDFHNVGAEGIGGIVSHEKIETNKDLLRVLKASNYEIIRPK